MWTTKLCHYFPKPIRTDRVKCFGLTVDKGYAEVHIFLCCNIRQDNINSVRLFPFDRIFEDLREVEKLDPIDINSDAICKVDNKIIKTSSYIKIKTVTIVVIKVKVVQMSTL